MRYTFTIISLIILFVSSCKKPANQPRQVLKQITKISSSPTDFRSFTYDANKRLTNHTIQFINGNGTSVMSVDYSYVNGVINTATSPGAFANYEMDGGRVKTVRTFRLNGTAICVIDYNYNSKGQLIEWKETFSQPQVDQPKETKQIFEYYPDGNVKLMKYYVKMTIDGDFVLNGTTLYDQYDQFINPEVSFPGTIYLPSIVFQKNNIGRMRHYAANGELYQTNTFEYTYDADGYPATKLFKDDRSTIDILFTYTY